MVPRTGHTATLLPTGEVLVVGGEDERSGELTSSAELYNPKARTWRAAGNLEIPRGHHTATVLDSGLVLIIGGSGEHGALANAELYDPSTGDWTTHSSQPGTARFNHTATLLESGLVLVTGGENEQGPTMSVEIYAPLKNTWEVANPLLGPRSWHVATLLPSGSVLVAGGTDGVSGLTRAELYDPIARFWTATDSLDEPRIRASATLLPDGRVVLAGGANAQQEPMTSVEVYSPSQGTWSTSGSLIIARFDHAAVLLPSGRILLAGGAGTSSLELMDPPPKTWKRAWFPRRKLKEHAAVSLADGRILVVGGEDVDGDLARADVYDPDTGAWTQTGSLNRPRRNLTLTRLVSGKILAAGGGDACSCVLWDRAELYDPATGLWEETGSLTTPREHHAAVLLVSGKVLVVGGEGSEAAGSAELYDPDTGEWQVTGSPMEPRVGHTLTRLPSGEVLMVGSSSTAEIYDPWSGEWNAGGYLEAPRANHTATLLPSGEVMVIGGRDDHALATVEVYNGEDSEEGTWRTLEDELAVAREHHTATLLGRDQIVVSGGRDGDSLVDVEVYDLSTRSWKMAAPLGQPRAGHTALALRSEHLLIFGGDETFAARIERFGLTYDIVNRPTIRRSPRATRYGWSIDLVGDFGSVSEGSSSATQSSAASYPFVELRSADNLHLAWLEQVPRINFSDDPMTLTVRELPPSLAPGSYLLAVVRAGVASEPVELSLRCSLAITANLAPEPVELGAAATFAVETQGAMRFQWQKGLDPDPETGEILFADISDANASIYTSPPVTSAEAGSVYRVVASNGCTSVISEPMPLQVVDTEPPFVEVVAPEGGEFWILTEAGETQTELITWDLSDNLRVCYAEVELLASDDNGETYVPVPDGSFSFEANGTCPHPGVTTTSQPYELGETPPSGQEGSVYKVRVRAVDMVGNETLAESARPFFIVSDSESVTTLILANLSRMRQLLNLSAEDEEDLWGHLQNLAHYPGVGGRVIDLAGVPDLAELYEAWDANPADATLANRLLFGCHAPLPPGCQEEIDGIHDLVLGLLETFPNVESLVLVGDDRILPMARIQDRTSLLPESAYTDLDNGGDLEAHGSTVGQAAASNFYLSDDPMAVRRPVHLDDLGSQLFLPDLAIGRLVETPAEIATTISSFFGHNGELNLAALPADGHKVQVTGYDFLIDSARRIWRLWQAALGTLVGANTTAPADGQLVGEGEDWVSSADAGTVDGALIEHLCGNGGAPYRVLSLNGHAVHDAEGVPGNGFFDIQGVHVDELLAPNACDGAPLDLDGSVIYAVGCHSGLPVAGSDPRSTDLAQTFLGRGVVAYVANTGYGWGLRHGIGYSERLVEIFTEEMISGDDDRPFGEVVRRAKLRYFHEAPGLDPYDMKTLMQWTVFGLPMYRIDPGVVSRNSGESVSDFLAGPPPRVEDLPPVQTFGQVSAGQGRIDDPSIPEHVIAVGLDFDLTGSGVYTLYRANGEIETEGICSSTSEGCYFTLKNLVERASGATDRAVQPYLVWDSRLAGTSQHGVLWLGGSYDEIEGWLPVIAELISNGGDASNHGSTPRRRRSKAHGPRALGEDAAGLCRASDDETNSLVITTGELFDHGDGTFTERIARRIDLQTFYFNNPEDISQNCDREGPSGLRHGAGPFDGEYHRLNGRTLEWAAELSDDAGVWRAVVVYDDGTKDAQGRGRWQPLELATDAEGTWRGSLDVPVDASGLTYFLQAVDNRGNVSWLDFAASELPASGVEPDFPLPVDVPLEIPPGDLEITLDDFPDPVPAGFPVAYTVTARNKDPENLAVGLTATVDLPGELLAVGAGAWSCFPESSGLSCNLDILHPETSSDFIAVVFAPDTPSDIVATAVLEAHHEDPAPDDNLATETTQVIAWAPTGANGIAPGDVLGEMARAELFARSLELGGAQLLRNPGFDRGLAGWLRTGTPTWEIDHAPGDDSQIKSPGLSDSGSVRIVQARGKESDGAATLSQCVVGHPGPAVWLGGRLRAGAAAGDLGPDGDVRVNVLVEAFGTRDCLGEPLASAVALRATVQPDGVWRFLAGRAEVSPLARSVLVTFVVEGSVEGGLEGVVPEVHLDDLFLFADPTSPESFGRGTQIIR